MDESTRKACKEAGRKLYDKLASMGVNLNGVGIAATEDGHPAIAIRVLTAEDLKNVPSMFEGYEG